MSDRINSILQHLACEIRLSKETKNKKLKSSLVVIDYENNDITTSQIYYDKVNSPKKKGSDPEKDIKILPDGRVGTKDAAKYLGLSLKTLAMYRSNGQGPRFVKKGRIFYFIDDLNEWLQKGRVQDNPPRGEK